MRSLERSVRCLPGGAKSASCNAGILGQHRAVCCGINFTLLSRLLSSCMRGCLRFALGGKVLVDGQGLHVCFPLQPVLLCRSTRLCLALAHRLRATPSRHYAYKCSTLTDQT